MKNSIILSAFCFLASFASSAQSGKMDFEKYDPISNLVVPEHKLQRAKFPFIDVHNHQWEMQTQDLSALVADMDKLNLQVMINLSGGNGNGLKKMMDNVNAHFPKRFIVFANIEFSNSFLFSKVDKERSNNI